MSDLGRQGHGFQRTFIIAALEYLAETAASLEEGLDRPTLLLTIEEPELYQHPPRARHFFNTLRILTQNQSVQVCYATHSPYFVAPPDFASIRLFRRVPHEAEDMPAGVSVTAANIETVAASLDKRHQMELGRYLARTMQDAFCEAFFARVALLVEGPTDLAVLAQAAKLMGHDFHSLGVVCVPVSKSALPVALAVLNSLEIPTYMVFDADSNAKDQDHAKSENRALVAALGEEICDFPETGARKRWACFTADLETFLDIEIPQFRETAGQIRQEMGWTAEKAPEVYAEAIERLGTSEIPAMIRAIVGNVLALAAE